ncbi:MAG TPA: hypothetical protein VHX61_17970 [Rhizomicrobium sp.]|jgi:DNA-binding MarR family transcriptional regulator|nr:hypothetical protein [Rhizomicrobium sp.]
MAINMPVPGPKEPGGKADGEEGNASDLINELVRLVGRLGEHPILKESGLGLTEWSFLKTVAASPGLGGGQIAGRLGVTPQRSTQISSTLAESGYLTIAPSADDTRRKLLTITPKGKSTADAIDARLTELFQHAFPDVPKSIVNTSRNIRKLLKAVSPAPKEAVSPPAKKA